MKWRPESPCSDSLSPQTSLFAFLALSPPTRTQNFISPKNKHPVILRTESSCHFFSAKHTLIISTLFFGFYKLNSDYFKKLLSFWIKAKEKVCSNTTVLWENNRRKFLLLPNQIFSSLRWTEVLFYSIWAVLNITLRALQQKLSIPGVYIIP